MKVLLINFDIKGEKLPLALGYLKAYAQDKFDIKIKTFPVTLDDKYVLSVIKKEKPTVIGFSAYIWNIKKIHNICKKIKSKIFLGGPCAKFSKDVDIVINGEGEVTFLNLLRWMNGEIPLEKILGVSYKKNGRIIRNKDRGLIDVNKLPSPFNAIDLDEYYTNVAVVQSCRGCNFHCTFCNEVGEVRYFSVDRVVSEIKLLVSKGFHRIWILDPVFNLNKKRAISLCKKLIGVNAEFVVEVRAEFMDAEIAKWMKKANIKNVSVGIQSVNPVALKNVGRTVDKKKLKGCFKLLKDFNTAAELIVGLPGDSYDSYMDSLEFVVGLKPKMIINYLLQVLPGSKLMEDVDKFKIKFDSKNQIISNYSFSKEEIKVAKQMADKFCVENGFL